MISLKRYQANILAICLFVSLAVAPSLLLSIGMSFVEPSLAYAEGEVSVEVPSDSSGAEQSFDPASVGSDGSSGSTTTTSGGNTDYGPGGYVVDGALSASSATDSANSSDVSSSDVSSDVSSSSSSSHESSTTSSDTSSGTDTGTTTDVAEASAGTDSGMTTVSDTSSDGDSIYMLESGSFTLVEETTTGTDSEVATDSETNSNSETEINAGTDTNTTTETEVVIGHTWTQRTADYVSGYAGIPQLINSVGAIPGAYDIRVYTYVGNFSEMPLHSDQQQFWSQRLADEAVRFLNAEENTNAWQHAAPEQVGNAWVLITYKLQPPTVPRVL